MRARGGDGNEAPTHSSERCAGVPRVGILVQCSAGRRRCLYCRSQVQPSTQRRAAIPTRVSSIRKAGPASNRGGRGCVQLLAPASRCLRSARSQRVSGPACKANSIAACTAQSMTLQPYTGRPCPRGFSFRIATARTWCRRSGSGQRSKKAVRKASARAWSEENVRSTCTCVACCAACY